MQTNCAIASRGAFVPASRMSKKSKAPEPTGLTGSPVFWIIVILVVAGLLLWFAVPRFDRPPSAADTGSPATPATASTPAAPKAATAGAVAPEKLHGRWLRPDGGYVIEITGATPDGKLQAAYFNPSPINVGLAEWTREGAALRVLVELRAPNYPGSTYKLLLRPGEDKLTGQYFQAATGQTFDVEFEREK
jgi:hypothetical protein